MLVLTLRPSERVVFQHPNGSKMGVVSYGPNNQGQAKLAFEFSKDIKILREELLQKEQVHKNNTK